MILSDTDIESLLHDLSNHLTIIAGNVSRCELLLKKKHELEKVQEELQCLAGSKEKLVEMIKLITVVKSKMG